MNEQTTAETILIKSAADDKADMHLMVTRIQWKEIESEMRDMLKKLRVWEGKKEANDMEWRSLRFGTIHASNRKVITAEIKCEFSIFNYLLMSRKRMFNVKREVWGR